MGWCHEFGPQIHEGCAHPMVAGAASCTCAECGVECRGRFNGCAAVWQRGPVALPTMRAMEPDVIAQATHDSRIGKDLTAVDFSLARIIDTRPPAEPPPAPPPGPKRAEPVARVTAPRPPAARRVPPPPSRRVPPPALRRVPDADGDRLAVLRARIEGLRGEVKALGDSIGNRPPRTPSPAADPG